MLFRGNDLQIDGVVTQLAITKRHVIQFQLSFSLQFTSGAYKVHPECRVRADTLDTHQSVRQTCVRTQRSMRLSFRHRQIQSRLDSRQIHRRKAKSDRREGQTCLVRVGSERQIDRTEIQARIVDDRLYRTALTQRDIGS